MVAEFNYTMQAESFGFYSYCFQTIDKKPKALSFDI